MFLYLLAFGFLTAVSSFTVLTCTSTSLNACLGSKNLLSILSGATKPNRGSKHPWLRIDLQKRSRNQNTSLKSQHIVHLRLPSNLDRRRRSQPTRFLMPVAWWPARSWKTAGKSRAAAGSLWSGKLWWWKFLLCSETHRPTSRPWGSGELRTKTRPFRKWTQKENKTKKNIWASEEKVNKGIYISFSKYVHIKLW